MDTAAEQVGPQVPEEPKKNHTQIAIFGLVAVIIVLAGGFIFIDDIKKMFSDEDKVEEKNDELTTYRDTCTTVYDDLDAALASPEKVCILDLTDQNIATISAEVGSLPRLHTLILTGNPISEENKTAINEALSKRDPQIGYDLQF